MIDSENDVACQHYGKDLDLQTKQEISEAIKVMMGPVARKWPIAIRLVEVLHKQPAVWAPYKELFLPERIQTEFTMTSEEFRNRLKLVPSALDVDDYAQRFLRTKFLFDGGFKAMSKLASLVLPGVEISPAELTWAFTVAQSRAVNRNGSAELIPLFDMFNHAPGRDDVCDFSVVTVAMAPAIRASMAMDAAPTQLRVAWAGQDLELLRGDTPLGKLDDCCIILAPPRGLRAGEEACFSYHDTSELSLDKKVGFLLQYGFYPPS